MVAVIEMRKKTRWRAISTPLASIDIEIDEDENDDGNGHAAAAGESNNVVVYMDESNSSDTGKYRRIVNNMFGCGGWGPELREEQSGLVTGR